jgi:outer membrane PBP1 activator LpoA protein
MLICRLKGLFAALVLGYLAGCATPGSSPSCAPGRLCAPEQPNTSAQPQAGALAAPAPAAQAAVLPAPRQPALPPSPPPKIALLVPLQSATLALPAKAVRDGFMAAWERDRTSAQVDVIATGDELPAVLDAYKLAAASHDIVVGPLARAAVDALASAGTVPRPTIVLNHPDPGIAVPPHMLAIGLSIEDEARQAADWAAREHPNGRALILAGDESWQKRMAEAFEQRWSELRRNSHMADLPAAAEGKVDPDALDVVRTRNEVDPPELIFAALDAGQLRQVRAVLGTATDCYAASPANPGRAGQPVAELEGLRLLDLPWEVQPGDQAAAPYPRWVESSHTADMDRLYALGIDAFRMAQAIAQHPGAPVLLNGVTGKLAASLQGDPAFARTEMMVVYRDGRFEQAAR